MILKNLFNDLIKYVKQIKLENFEYKLTKVKNVKVDVDTHFLPDKIRLYINNEIKYKYEINYKYNNKKINIQYFSKEKNKKKIIKLILKRVLFMYNITNKFININLIIYDTPYQKRFSCSNHKNCDKLNTINVNSGFSYTNNIVIFRKEELLKLVIHEMIHALDVDVKYENNQNKDELLNMFCIDKTNVLINESYVETWATILNVFMVLYEKNIVKLDLFKKYLKDEQIFGMYQSSKLCKYYNINKFDLIYKINNICKIKMEDNVNIFSYHIIKTVNLSNINEFIKIFRHKKYIMDKTYNYKDYIMFIIKYFKTIDKTMNNTIKNLDNNYNLSLKMTKIE